MIRFQPITTSDVQHYKFMEELLVESFPPEEYRQLAKDFNVTLPEEFLYEK